MEAPVNSVNDFYKTPGKQHTHIHTHTHTHTHAHALVHAHAYAYALTHARNDARTHISKQF